MCEARSAEVHEQQKPPVSNSIGEFADFKLFWWDLLLFQLFNMTEEVYLFSSSYVTQKWTYLGDLAANWQK